MKANSRPLTISDSVTLGEICRAVQGSLRVARLLDGNVLIGTARSIGDANGNFALPDEDVRDCFLRVTLRTGLEAFWNVEELMPLISSGEFVIGYED